MLMIFQSIFQTGLNTNSKQNEGNTKVLEELK